MVSKRVSLVLLTLVVCSTAKAERQSFWGAREFYTHQGHKRYLLLFPPHYNPHKRYDLWVNLHGIPGCAGQAVILYRDAAVAREIFLLAPQANGWSARSYVRPDGRTDVYRAWDDRRDPARILAAVDEVVRKYPIDPQHIALLGFSGGCEMGWRVLARRPNEFCFFGGVANGFKLGKPPVSDAALRLAARHTAHFYAAGEEDPFAGLLFTETAAHLRADGFRLRTVYAAGVGHALPPSIQIPLLNYLDEICGRPVKGPEGGGAPARGTITSALRHPARGLLYGAAGIGTVVALALLLRRRDRR